MANVSINELVQGLGGIDNLSSATHCATRLRVTPKDKEKVNIEALKKVGGVLGVVDGASQVQIIIGAEVTTVYNKFVEETGVSEDAVVDENLDDIKTTKN